MVKRLVDVKLQYVARSALQLLSLSTDEKRLNRTNVGAIPTSAHIRLHPTITVNVANCASGEKLSAGVDLGRKGRSTMLPLSQD